MRNNFLTLFETFVQGKERYDIVGNRGGLQKLTF